MSEQYELTDRNQPRPRTPQWFEDALKQISADTGIQLRLVWSCEREGIRWDEKVKLYATAEGMHAKHVGWFKGHYVSDGMGGEKLKRTGYYPANAFPRYSPEAAQLLEDGTWLIPDINYWMAAWPRWIVEKKANDRERTAWERDRYEWDPETGQRIDALGPWPEDGVWLNFFVICQHLVLCCNQATAAGHLCYGVGRDPLERDLEDIRKEIHRQLEAPKLPEPGSQDWNRQYGHNTKAAYAAHREAEGRQKALYKDIMKNAVAPTLGSAASMNSTLKEYSRFTSLKQDKFQQAARAHLLEMERKGDVVNGNSN